MPGYPGYVSLGRTGSPSPCLPRKRGTLLFLSVSSVYVLKSEPSMNVDPCLGRTTSEWRGYIKRQVWDNL